MKLVLGLGNPGATYKGTRHNVGFWALSEMAQKYGGVFKVNQKLKAEIAEIVVENEKVLLIKSTTYYNESGQVARAVVDYYKANLKDLLIIHDELMIDFGTVRTRTSGRDAGNNGIKSLITHVNSDQFARVRIGTGTPLRDLAPDYDFVLGRFSTEEQAVLQNDLLPIILNFIEQFIGNEFGNDSTSIKKLSEESDI